MWETVAESLKSVWDSKLTSGDEYSLDCEESAPAEAECASVSGTSAVLRDKFIFSEETDVVFGFKTISKNGSTPVTFSAHRLVLSLWSPYFANQFYGNNKLENIVIVNDVDPQAFNFMLRFMYEGSPVIETCEEALQIFKAAVKYQVQPLIKKSRDYVKHFKPQISDVLEVLEAAIYMNLKYMEEYCLKLIQSDTSEIFASCDIAKVSTTIISSILDMHFLSFSSEYELLEWIFKWAKNEYVTKSQYCSVREVLREFLPRLHFVSLTSKEFAQFYKLHEQFFEKEEAFSILMNISLPLSMPLPEWQDDDACFRCYTGPSRASFIPRQQGWDVFD